MKTFNCAVIGCGVISENHIYAIEKLDGLKLVAVCDVMEERAKKTAEKYNTKYYTDYKEMADKEQLDGVHICLPHYLHKEVTVYFIKKGIPVLCEKPMAINALEGQVMIDTAEKYGTKMDIVFQNRFNASTKLVLNTIESGKLGKVEKIEANVKWQRTKEYYENGKWRGVLAEAGGGSLINQAIHTLDLSRLIAGSEVKEVSAQVKNLDHSYIEVEDTVNAVVTFENGVVLTFFSTNNNDENEPVYIKAICEKGTVELTSFDACITLNDGTVLKNDRDKENFYGVKEEYGTGHIYQVDRFYFGNKEQIKENVYQALKTQKLIDTIYEKGLFNAKCTMHNAQ